MRPELAGRPTEPRRRALVLGSRGVAALIGRQLQDQGFEVDLEADRPSSAGPTGGLGLPNSTRASQDLRKLLSDFIAEDMAKLGASSRDNTYYWVHPGATAWAERPELPVIAQELGMTAIAPPARVLSLFSNRLMLIGEAEKFKIPNLLLSQDPLHSAIEIERLVRTQNQPYPFVLKTVRGGSTFGLRVIQDPEDLGKPFALWLEQLRSNLGEVMLLAERYLEGARRFVVPFARMPDGQLQFFPTTDASLQCRYRKVVQFCPANHLDQGVEKEMHELSEKLLTQTGFIGVGSLEFLVDGEKPFLIEGLARLNTDFHLWEGIAGTSAVAWQLAAMTGGKVHLPPMTETKARKFGISLRFYAEDSTLQLPQPGLLREMGERTRWDYPGAEAEFSPSVRVGEFIAPSGHGLVGHLWIFAEDSRRAFTIARGALEELWFAGSLQVNDRFLLDLISHPWVQEGMFHAGFVDEEFIPVIRPPVELLRLFSAVCAAHPLVQADSGPERWAVGDQWVKTVAAHPVWKEGPELWEADGLPGVSGWLEGPEGRSLRVCAYPVPGGLGKWQVRIGKWIFPVRRVLTPTGANARKASQPKLHALVPGRVHSLLYRPGALVPAHEPLLILESLGMLVPHALPIEVRVSSWKCAKEDLVFGGQELALLETTSRN